MIWFSFINVIDKFDSGDGPLPPSIGTSDTPANEPEEIAHDDDDDKKIAHSSQPVKTLSTMVMFFDVDGRLVYKVVNVIHISGCICW